MREHPSRALVFLAACVLTATGCTSAAGEPSLDPPASTPSRALAGTAASSPPPAAVGTPPSSEAAPLPPALACVSRLPQDVRIGQTMLVTTTDIGRVRPWLDDGLIAGILSSGRLSAATAKALDEATTGTRYGALLAADEEGGLVQRYEDLAGSIPSAQQQARTMSPAEVRRLYRHHGSTLADWGVDLVLAPVVDVGHGPGIGSRSYSDDADVVTEYATAAAEGYSDAGLLPVLKHFPGHGSSTGDTHDARAVGPTLEELRASDLEPFREIPRSVKVATMVGHTTIPGYSHGPSSQSREVIDGLLGDELGFDGLVVSDALGMAAAGEPTQGAALVGFLAAGGDLGIVGPGGSAEGRRAVRAALAEGAISTERLDDAAAAVLAAKGVDPCEVVPKSGQEPSRAPAESPIPEDDPVVNPTTVP